MGRLLIAAGTVLLALVLASAAGAGQRPREIETFADQFSGDFDCGTFTATLTGHDNGRITTWFDSEDNPIKQIGRIQSVETDVNPLTGKSIEVTTNLTVHVDFAAGTTTLTGVRNLSTQPGQGVVVQHVGRVITNSDGVQTFLSGKFPEFEEGYMDQDFCAALT
jgi:hypothetical protein